MKQLRYLIRTSYSSRSLGGTGYFLRWNRILGDLPKYFKHPLLTIVFHSYFQISPNFKRVVGILSRKELFLVFLLLTLNKYYMFNAKSKCIYLTPHGVSGNKVNARKRHVITRSHGNGMTRLLCRYAHKNNWFWKACCSHCSYLANTVELCFPNTLIFFFFFFNGLSSFVP